MRGGGPGQGGSLWEATAASPPVTAPPLESPCRADLCIVGGGYTGLATALAAREAGLETVVLEARQPGWGASGRNGGQVIPGIKLDPDALVARFGRARAEPFIDFVGATADGVAGLVSRHGIECGFERCGWLAAAHTPEALAALSSRACQWAARGADVALLDGDEVRARTGTGAYLGGFLDRRAGALHPLDYARGLARAAAGAGARIRGESPVTSVHPAPGPERGRWEVHTPRARVVAERVVLATNGYAGAFGARAWPRLARTVVPVTSFQVATEPLGANRLAGILPGGHVVSDTRRLLRYFRLGPEGRLLMGARGRGEGDDPAPRLYRHVEAEVRALYPGLFERGVRFTHRWGGRVAVTADELPHLHVLAPGVFAALGYNGRGVALASAMGALLARLAAGEDPEGLPVPVAPLRPVPAHALRRLALPAAVLWKGWLDRREDRARARRSGGSRSPGP